MGLDPLFDQFDFPLEEFHGVFPVRDFLLQDPLVQQEKCPEMGPGSFLDSEFGHKIIHL